jgi:hypothetical protein
MVLCVALEGLVAPRELFPEGSEVRWCHLCAEEVLVSPSGLEFIEKEGALPVCLECAAGLPEGPVDFAPGAREELRKEGTTDAEIKQAMAIAKHDLARRRARRR